MATCQFIQGKITHINKLLLIHYKTMYKISPCIVQLGRYSLVKKNHHVFGKSFVLPSFWNTIFINHVIKPILSEAELRADQDGA